MNKKIIIAIISLFILIGGAYIYLNWSGNNGSIRPIYFVPKDAVFIIETDEPIEAWKKINNNKVWTHFLGNESFKEISSGLDALNTLIEDNKFVFDLVGSRKVMVSAHMYKRNDYDFLYLIDIKGQIKTGSIEDILKNTVDKEFYNVSVRDYKESQIIELFDKEFKETLYLSVYENVLMTSYRHSLIENSLDEYENPIIGRDINFIEVTDHTDDSDLFKLFLNYRELPNYMSCFLEEKEPIVHDLSKSLFYSGFTFDLDENGEISLSGFSNVNDTINTFLNALNKSGKGDLEISKVAPNITAFYMSMGFDNLKLFVDNFESSMKVQDSIAFNSYQDNIYKIEKFLKINIEENFIDWIGDEITYLQLQAGGLGSKNEFAFFMKANDVDDAKSSLEFIKKQIKKKTPGKFKAVNYEGYEINYLSIKGFFKAIMGKFFSKLEKPYYTIIDDYVVFSNHPQTLRVIIDRYIEGKTLVNDETYKSFENKFNKKSNLMLYIHSGKVFSNLKELSDPETKVSLDKNKKFIVCFEQIGFQLMNDDNLFETNMKTTFVDPNNIKMDNNLSFKNLSKLNFENHKIENDLFATVPIRLKDFDVKKYEKFFTNDILKVEVGIRDGMKHGVYKQYYDDGTLMLKGHFEDDLKEGVWKFYNLEGKVVEKRNYSKGKIID